MRSIVMPTLLVAAVVVAGCGDSSSDDATAPSDATTAPSVTTIEPASTDPPAAEPPASSSAPSDTVAEPSDSSAPESSASGDEPLAISSVCDLLTLDDLRNNPFFVDEPVSEGNDYGEGFLECGWTGDFEPHEVRVSVIPLAAWEEDFSTAVPLDLMGEDIGGGELYDSLLGIGRVGRGTTVVHFVGDRAILTAVRTGEDGALASDRVFAVDLALRILDRL